MLAITGAKDVQVDAGDLDIVARVGPAGTETLVVADVDHILRHEPSPISNPRFYNKQVAKPIDPRVTAAIEQWLEPIAAEHKAGNGSPTAG